MKEHLFNNTVYFCFIFSFHFQHIFSLFLAGRVTTHEKNVVMCWVAKNSVLLYDFIYF